MPGFRFKTPQAALNMLRGSYPDARLILTDEREAEDDSIDLGDNCGLQIEATSLGLIFHPTLHEYDAGGDLVAVSHGEPSEYPLVAAHRALMIGALTRHHGKAATHDGLTAEFAAWLADNPGLPDGDAQELLFCETLTDEQRRYLSDFVLRWEAVDVDQQEDGGGGSFRVLCHRGAGSGMGAATAYLKQNGEVVAFPTLAAARAEADRLNRESRSPHVSYSATEV